MTDATMDLDDEIDLSMPDPKIWLYPFLAELGVTRIEASMSGSGDSGDLDDVTWYRGDEMILPTGKEDPFEAPDTGIVTRWLVSEGDIVRAGDPLCEVDPVEARLELQLCRERLSALEQDDKLKKDQRDAEMGRLNQMITGLEDRVANTLMTAPADGYVNALDLAPVTFGFTRGDTLLILTPLTEIETILSKLTVDDGSTRHHNFLDEIQDMFKTDGNAAGNWYDGDGGGVFCTYELDPEAGVISLIDADYTPGEEYDNDEDDDWEPEFGETEEEDPEDDDVEP